MNINNIVTNAIQVNKQNTEKFLDTIDALHIKNEDITEKTVNGLGVIPNQGKEAILQWIEILRETRQNLKRQALEGHDNLEKLLKAA